MATRPGIMSVGIVDAYGIASTSSAMIAVDDTQTISTLLTELALFSAKIAPLTQGVVTYSKVSIKLETGNDTSTALGDIEKTGVFNFSNATDSYAQAVIVPDIAPSVLVGGKIDLTNTDVTNFITFMTTIHTAITVVTKGVRALSALLDALLSFRKHRKPLTRKTKEL